MRQQNEWMQLLAYSSRYQSQMSQSADKQKDIVQNLQKRLSDKCNLTEMEFSSTEQKENMHFLLKNNSNLSNGLSRVKQLSQENDKSQVEQIQYHYLSKASQTQNEYIEEINEQLTKTIQGLTDQVLQYRKKIDKLQQLQSNRQSNDQEEETKQPFSIYTTKGQINKQVLEENRNKMLLRPINSDVSKLKQDLSKERQKIKLITNQNLILKKSIQSLILQIDVSKLKQQHKEAAIFIDKYYSKANQKSNALNSHNNRQIEDLPKKYSFSLAKNSPKIQSLSTTDEQPTLIKVSQQNEGLSTYELKKTIHQQQKMIKQLKNNLLMKNESIDYTQKMLIKAETERMNAHIQQQLLEQQIAKLQKKYGLEQRHSVKITSQQYCRTIQKLQCKIYTLEETIRQKKQKKIAPEMLSPQQTVLFLIKVLQKVPRSANLQRLLLANCEFKNTLINICQKVFPNQ